MANSVQVMSPFEERLSSLPMIPKKRSDIEGAEPTSGQKPSNATSLQAAPPDAEEVPKTNTLMDADDQTAFRTVEQLVRSQDRVAKNRWAIDTYYRWTDAGIPFGRLDKIPNQSIWVAKLPPGAARENRAAIPNKANDLCNKVTQRLLNDPPQPNPQARTNMEGAREAGELASQFLRINGGESGLNRVQNYRWGLRNALVCASSFLVYELDPNGGGYQPLQVLAAPKALVYDPQNPNLEPTGPPDPMTGQPSMQPTVNPILRYLSPDGQFVPTAAQADKVWLPKIRIKRKRREQIRTFPIQSSIEECQAAIIIDYCTVAEGIARWSETVGKMSPTELASLASWRPALSEIIVPFLFRGGNADGMTGPALDEVGTFSPILQRRMFFYTMYIPATPEYDEGLHLDVSGMNGGTILHREGLDYTVTMPNGDQELRCRDIPIVQITPCQDITDMDPMGFPFISRFSGSAEAAATLYAAYADYLDRGLHPHVFIHSDTPVDDDDWANRMVPIILNPGDPPPNYEIIPPPPDIVRVAGDMHQQQDVASGLNETAQGLETDSSVSGIAKNITVQQAAVQLSDILQQSNQAFTRGWRIECQIAQAKFTTPQLLSYDGTGGASEEVWFKGEDLAGIDDIGIEPGTGTMMTAEGKAQYVSFMQANGWITSDRAAEVGVTGIARDLGLPPDPIEQAINRAVTGWLKGPPEGWELQEQQYQEQVAAYTQATMPTVQAHAEQDAQAQLGGAPPAPPPALPPPPQRPWSPFSPRPNDTEPGVALAWVRRLSKLMLSPEYDAAIPAWKTLVDEKYLTARQAIQPPPMPGNPGQGGTPGQPTPQVPGQPQVMTQGLAA